MQLLDLGLRRMRTGRGWRRMLLSSAAGPGCARPGATIGGPLEAETDLFIMAPRRMPGRPRTPGSALGAAR